MNFYLFRVFQDGTASTVMSDNGTVSDMIDRAVYAAKLTVEEEIPTAIPLKGDDYGPNRRAYWRMAVEASQEIFNR